MFNLDASQRDESTAVLLEAAGGGLRREVEHRLAETDFSLRHEGLLRLADREAALGNLNFAVEVYSWVEARGSNEAASAARERIAALRGGGGFGARCEGLLRGFAREAGDPATLLAMAAGGGVYRAAKLATMSRLSGRLGWFGRGAGLRFAGGVAGLAAETPVFTTVARLGHGMQPFGAGWGEELKSAYLVLGGMKSAGGVAHSLSRGVASAQGRKFLVYGGMYGGILMGRGLESAFALRDWRPGGDEWVEGLATLLQFKVSGDLLSRAGGTRRLEVKARFEIAETQLSQGGAVVPVRAANDGWYPPISPAANGPHRRAAEQTWALASGGEMWSPTAGAEPMGTPKFFVLSSQGRDPEGGDPAGGKTGLRSASHRDLAGAADPEPRESSPTDPGLADLLSRAKAGEAKALRKFFSRPRPTKSLLELSSSLSSSAPEVTERIKKYLIKADLGEVEADHARSPWLVFNLLIALAELGHARSQAILPEMLKPHGLSWSSEADLRAAQRLEFWRKRAPKAPFAEPGGAEERAEDAPKPERKRRPPSRKIRPSPELARQSVAGDRKENRPAGDKPSDIGETGPGHSPQPPPSDREVRMAYAQLNSMVKGMITADPRMIRESEEVLRRFFQGRSIEVISVEGVSVVEMVTALKSGMNAEGELGQACTRILAADKLLGPYLEVRRRGPKGLADAD